jgi:hypothetical protein
MGWFFFAALGLGYLATRPSTPTVPPQPTYVGLYTEMLDFVAAAQSQDMWCWAASVQTILNSYGIPIDQDQIVARVYGSPINEPGTDAAISASLNGWGLDSRGRRVVVQCRVAPGPPSLAVLVRELAQRHPILVTFNPGLPMGHAVVITRISHIGRCITSLVFRDPWPTDENRANRGRVEIFGPELAQFLSCVRSHWLVYVSIG